MIIQLEGGTAENIGTAKQSLAALAHSWGHELTAAPASAPEAARPARHDDKAIDPEEKRHLDETGHGSRRDMYLRKARSTKIEPTRRARPYTSIPSSDRPVPIEGDRRTHRAVQASDQTPEPIAKTRHGIAGLR